MRQTECHASRSAGTHSLSHVVGCLAVVLIGFALPWAGVAAAEEPAITAAAARPPNVVVILADDLGRSDYSAFGTGDIRTPHIDRLCREGMTFTNFRANSSVCSPTRAALLTGCYPDRVGVPGVIRDETPENSWGRLAPHATLLPQRLKPAGYHTAIIGKWHLGTVAPDTPNDRGFDFFHGFLGDMMDDYRTHLRNGRNYMRRDREVIEPVGHATDLFTEWACDYLAERSRAVGPFFLYLAYTAPHGPIQPPQSWLDAVRAREPAASPARARFVALVEHMDDGVGKVLEALDRLGLADDTLVIFTSDNGGSLAEGGTNGPWRGEKTQMYEGGLRVPAVVRWPGRVAAGASTDHSALSMDIFATVCEAAGVRPGVAAAADAPPAEIDAVSFVPTLRGEAQPPPRGNAYFVRREGGRAFMGKTTEAVIRGEWKFVVNSPFGPAELFNLARDPGERDDVAAREPRIVDELGSLLRGHVRRGGRVPWQ